MVNKRVTKPKERLCATELCPRVHVLSRVKLAVLEPNIGLNLGLSACLHWQTGRLTVWVNAKQNSGLKMSFQNRLFRLRKSVPSTENRPRKPGTDIKVGFD